MKNMVHLSYLLKAPENCMVLETHRDNTILLLMSLNRYKSKLIISYSGGSLKVLWWMCILLSALILISTRLVDCTKRLRSKLITGHIKAICLKEIEFNCISGSIYNRISSSYIERWILQLFNIRPEFLFWVIWSFTKIPFPSSIFLFKCKLTHYLNFISSNSL